MLDPVAFRVGPLEIRWYALFISTALILGIVLALKEANRKKISEDFFLDFFLYGIPAAIIGARLYYVFFRWSLYSGQPSRIIAIWEGGLAIHGGIIGGLLVLIVLVKKRKVMFWQVVDVLAPPLILGKAIGRWGNFINQEAYGNPVSEEFISYFPEFIQNQMYITDQIGSFYRNPAFLYSSIWNLLVFIFLIWLRRKEFVISGDIFLVYLLAYSGGRFFIEGIRVDSLMLGPFRIAQILSVVLILLSLLLLIFRHKKGVRN